MTYDSGILEEILKLDDDTKANITIQKNDFFDVHEYEQKMEKKRKRRRKPTTTLENFMEQ